MKGQFTAACVPVVHILQSSSLFLFLLCGGGGVFVSGCVWGCRGVGVCVWVGGGVWGVCVWVCVCVCLSVSDEYWYFEIFYFLDKSYVIMYLIQMYCVCFR